MTRWSVLDSGNFVMQAIVACILQLLYLACRKHADRIVSATVTLKSLVSLRPLKRHRHKIPRGSRQASSRLQVVSA